MPPTAMRLQSAKLQYFLLGLVILGSLLFYFGNALVAFDTLIHHADRARLPFDMSAETDEAVRPLPEAEEAGLHPQDRILAINGVPFTGMAKLIREVARVHAGGSLAVTYRTLEGRTRTTRVELLPVLPKAPPFSGWLVSIVRIVVFPAFCLFLGYWVVLAKPRDWNAWFFLGIMNVVPVSFGLWGYYPGLLTPFTLFWQTFAVRSMFVSLVLFGIYFPVRSRIDRRHPWIKWLLIVPQLCLIPCTILLHYGLLYDVERVQDYLWAIDPLRVTGNVFAVLSLAVFIAAVLRKLLTVPGADARRRLGVVLAGSVLGLVPLLAILLVTIISGTPVDALLPPWAVITLLLLFALFPLSLAYTVIVQRALDVRIFLRQGTRYALARGTLWVVQAAVLLYLVYKFFRFIHESAHSVVHLIEPIVVVLIVLLLRLRVANTLSLWLDRRFFREAYSAEQVLSELSEQAREFAETGPLLRTILERIGETLHVEGMAVFLRKDGAFRLEQSYGLPGTLDASFPEGSPMLQAMERRGGLPRVVGHGTPGRAAASPSEVFALNELHAELLLPLPGRSRLAGFMVLGPKRSEEAYSSADRRLLRSVALQVGLAIENVELVHHLAEREAQQQRMKREIEIAQEVQARLFPQQLPKVEGVDLAGFCRTAQEIGGDYYDFIPLENGHLGIAIGDVSGKGISAALLMASMRAALRGLTLSGTLDPARLMQRMNQLAFDSSTSNRFTTFFYADYNPATRRLDYVNAGHEAPILIRSAEGNGTGGSSPEDRNQTQRLEIGGLVMGILPAVDYQQGTLELQQHDVLIAYTDGLSESMTTKMEEWGEERILEVAQASAHLSAQELLSRLVEGADGFSAGAPQHDDLTLVVVKAG